MKKKLILAVIAICWLMFMRLQSQEKDNLQSYQLLYNRAEALFNGVATDSTDSVALNYYSRIITQQQPTISNAALLYNCYERSGILKQGLGYSAEDILRDYYSAIQVQKYYSLNDSILFRLLLSAGNVYYMKGTFDSSVYYFGWAEKIINQYPGAGLAGDLYNSLGALYNEAGNYIQSGIYFSKALELTKRNHPELGEAIFAMSANIASVVRASGYNDSAFYLYKKLLDVAHPSLSIVKNISEIYLTKNQPDSALQYLKMAGEINGFYAISIHNAFAKAYMMKGDTKLAVNHLQIATELYNFNTQKGKDYQFAATQKYFGDLLVMEGKALAALPYYQQAIIQYDYKFNDSNVFVNPGDFVGEFASYSLFNALTAKAACFVTLYQQEKESKYLEAAIVTSDSAFALSDYIKKSIDNDEARLFLADQVFPAYNRAIDFIMNANTNHDKDAIVHALEWISKSRATSLAISLKENTIKRYAGLPDSLVQKEKSAKVNISRLKLQLQQSRDTLEQQELVSEINTESLALQSIQDQFKKYPNYYNQKFAADKVDIPGIQKKILDNRTAAICYFKGGAKQYAFVVKHNEIVVHQLDSDSILEKSIDTYVHELTLNNTGKTYDAKAAIYLYSKLVRPLEADLKGISSLVIIPDQNLINVPFEAFQPSNDSYLLEDYTITYQYALPFLQKSDIQFNRSEAIAFAPFASRNVYASLDVLPSSMDEVAHFSKSSQLIDSAATKSKFIDAAGGASVIHLATHAAVDFQEPENSYIAFYKQRNSDTGYRIFAHELYNLQLSHTQFVFLSACETGSGKLSRSEGALSISRAFAFAGCPNIVTSLWKAEDKTTAYISKHFYDYVAKGHSYAQALQRAKIDLIKDETMTQFHSPAYWSHLVFIGNIQQEQSSIGWWIVLAGIVSVVGLLLLYKRMKRV